MLPPSIRPRGTSASIKATAGKPNRTSTPAWHGTGTLRRSAIRTNRATGRPDGGRPDPTRNCVCSTLRFSPLPCQAKRRGTNERPRTSILRNFGQPRSKPLELPLLGHRARSCRSRRCAAIAPRTTAKPGFIHAARPRRRRPAPLSHQRRRPLSASFPNRRVPRRTGACPRQARPSRALPAGGMRHIPCLRVRCASRRCGTRRGVVPTLLAPQRRLPAAHLSPGSVPRHRGTRRVRRLDSHRALRRTSSS